MSCRRDAQDHHDTIPVVTWRAGGSGSPPPMTRQFQHDDDDGRKDDASKMTVTISTTPMTPTPTTSAGGSGSPPPTRRRRRPPQGQRQQDGGDNIDNADDTNTDDNLNESMTRGPRLRWPWATKSRAVTQIFEPSWAGKALRRALTKGKFLERVDEAVHAAGLEPLQGHGIRIGSTLEYLLRGVPFDVVKAKGRWAGDSFALYLRKHVVIIAPYIQAIPALHETFIRYSMPPVR
ncbi:hypothetical protein EDB83DRAFT_2597184 [Lactarius deliciosus]|nr:hypothetical protein EDB83DRAFT_2597184 [Lactarius deliciosus]